MATDYPIIANCNYESADDDTIHRIRIAVDKGLTDDEALVEALDDLEETLEEHAESADMLSTQACERAEAAVLAAWTDEVRAAVEAAQRARYRD